MPREIYRRILSGYEPHEPAAMGEQLFYDLVLSLSVHDSKQKYQVAAFERIPKYLSARFIV